MSNIFRKSYTMRSQSMPCGDGEGVRSARYKNRGKTVTSPLTAAGDRIRVSSRSTMGRSMGSLFGFSGMPFQASNGLPS